MTPTEPSHQARLTSQATPCGGGVRNRTTATSGCAGTVVTSQQQATTRTAAATRNPSEPRRRRASPSPAGANTIDRHRLRRGARGPGASPRLLPGLPRPPCLPFLLGPRLHRP